MQRVLSIGWVLSNQFRTFRAGLETINVLMFPNFRQKLTLSAVRRLGGFDRRYYLAQLPENQRLFRLFALRHYAVFGEIAGLAPSAQFNPNTYLRINPDVDAAGVPPLWHWLTRGQNECRRVDDAGNAPKLPNDLPKVPKLNARSKQAELAAHIHVHYEDVWREIAGQLGQISLEIDLIVTLSYRGPETLHLRDQIQRAHPNTEVHILENRGRDILPFVTLINLGAFDGYRAVCKLHTKRSLHRVDGDRWRRRLLEGILRRDTSKLLRRFLDDPNLAIWVSDGQLLQGSKWWGGNKGRVNALLRRIELKPNSNHPYFPSGSMYWIKPFTIGMIRSLDLEPDDFEEESGQLDGTTAHAVERVVGELVLASGQKVIETSQLRHHTARGGETGTGCLAKCLCSKATQRGLRKRWHGKPQSTCGTPAIKNPMGYDRGSSSIALKTCPIPRKQSKGLGPHGKEPAWVRLKLAASFFMEKTNVTSIWWISGSKCLRTVCLIQATS